MARFKIIHLNTLQKNKKYRLLSQPSTPWSRNRGIVFAEVKNSSHVLVTNERGGDNTLFDVSQYGKTWGLQEVE